MKTYINRYGDKFTFKLTDQRTIQWSGDFKYHRFGYKESEDDKTFVDPSGGPFIPLGMDMKLFGFDGMIVDGFIPNDDGYEITCKIKK